MIDWIERDDDDPIGILFVWHPSRCEKDKKRHSLTCYYSCHVAIPRKTSPKKRNKYNNNVVSSSFSSFRPLPPPPLPFFS